MKVAIGGDVERDRLDGQPANEFVAPHATGSLHFDECRISADHMLGAPGQGFKVAMTSLDLFSTSVGAAGIGLAHRALDEALHHVKTRRMFGKAMVEIDGVQTKLADMVTDLATPALADRAAWAKDVIGGRCSREVSMAKLVGSEVAQRLVDAAVQLFGGGQAWPAETSSKICIAKCDRCASTRVLQKYRSWSLRATWSPRPPLRHHNR